MASRGRKEGSYATGLQIAMWDAEGLDLTKQKDDDGKPYHIGAKALADAIAALKWKGKSPSPQLLTLVAEHSRSTSSGAAYVAPQPGSIVQRSVSTFGKGKRASVAGAINVEAYGLKADAPVWLVYGKDSIEITFKEPSKRKR